MKNDGKKVIKHLKEDILESKKSIREDRSLMKKVGSKPAKKRTK